MNGGHCVVRCFQDVLDDPPSIGSIITVKHSGCYSTGILKQPVFWRERSDVVWKESSTLSSKEVRLQSLKIKHNRYLGLPDGKRENITNSSLIAWLQNFLLKTLNSGTKFPRKMSTN